MFQFDDTDNIAAQTALCQLHRTLILDIFLEQYNSTGIKQV